MRHAADADEVLEVLGHELRTVVRDDTWRHPREAFPGPLDDLLDFLLFHGCTDFPVDDEAAAAIQETAQVVEGTRDVEIRDVHVPVLMHPKGLLKARAFLGGLGVVPLQQSGLLEDAVHAGGAAGHDILVEHHEGQAAIALQGKTLMEGDDGLLLVADEPVVPRDPGVVLVGLAVTVLPRMPLGGGEAEPEQEGQDSQAGFVGPLVDKVNDLVADVMGDPEAGQSPPSSFFKPTCSSMSSESTSFLRWSLSSRAAILRSLASCTAWRRLPELAKAAAPFSKNCFCQR